MSLVNRNLFAVLTGGSLALWVLYHHNDSMVLCVSAVAFAAYLPSYMRPDERLDSRYWVHHLLS